MTITKRDGLRESGRLYYGRGAPKEGGTSYRLYALIGIRMIP